MAMAARAVRGAMVPVLPRRLSLMRQPQDNLQPQRLWQSHSVEVVSQSGSQRTPSTYARMRKTMRFGSGLQSFARPCTS